MNKLRPTLLLVLLLAALAPSAAHAMIRLSDVGIADQKADMFSDPRFAELGIKRARIDLAYDVLLDPAQTAALDQWMADAQADGVRVLVTFDRSRRPGRKTFRPDTYSLVKQFKRLRARYPFVKEWVTWNEPNLSQSASRTAHQWLALRKACPSCTILAADLVDRPNLARWAKTFIRYAHRQPAIWGLHNYADANQYTPRATKALLKAVKGKIWFTETGGVVRRNNGSNVKYKGQSLTPRGEGDQLHLHQARPPQPAHPARLRVPLERAQLDVGLGADLAQRQRAPRVQRSGEPAAPPAPLRQNGLDNLGAGWYGRTRIPCSGEVRPMNAKRLHITTLMPGDRSAVAALGRVSSRSALAS